MPNTPTTPASVASRLTDEEIELLAQAAEQEIQFWEAADAAAAVLRDYVRLRRLENAVKNLIHTMSVSISTQAKVEAYENVSRLIADAEEAAE